MRTLVAPLVLLLALKSSHGARAAPPGQLVPRAVESLSADFNLGVLKDTAVHTIIAVIWCVWIEIGT